MWMRTPGKGAEEEEVIEQSLTKPWKDKWFAMHSMYLWGGESVVWWNWWVSLLITKRDE